MKYLIILMTLFLSCFAFAGELPIGFKRDKIKLDGITYNVYKGGTGTPLLLIHGYAQSALMWPPVMEKFKNKFAMIIPDIRGIGDTSVTNDGYEKMTVAEDMKKILDFYKITKTEVVGHDIGLMIAYALAAKHPETVEKLVVMDAFLPGIGPGDSIYNDPNIWHFRFHGKYPEQLVSGREKIFFNSLWDGFSARPGSFPEKDKLYYISHYKKAGHMRAGFEYFKSFPQDAIDNKELSKTKLPMPVLVIGGEKSLGKALSETMNVVSDSVKSEIIMNCGHWLVEECPKETISALENFL